MTTIENQIGGAFHGDHRYVSLRQFPAGFANAFSRSITKLLDWQDRARDRRELRGLSVTELKDFGAGTGDASREGDKHFWCS